MFYPCLSLSTRFQGVKGRASFFSEIVISTNDWVMRDGKPDFVGVSKKLKVPIILSLNFNTLWTLVLHPRPPTTLVIQMLPKRAPVHNGPN